MTLDQFLSYHTAYRKSVALGRYGLKTTTRRGEYANALPGIPPTNFVLIYSDDEPTQITASIAGFPVDSVFSLNSAVFYLGSIKDQLVTALLVIEKNQERDLDDLAWHCKQLNYSVLIDDAVPRFVLRLTNINLWVGIVNGEWCVGLVPDRMTSLDFLSLVATDYITKLIDFVKGLEQQIT